MVSPRSLPCELCLSIDIHPTDYCSVCLHSACVCYCLPGAAGAWMGTAWLTSHEASTPEYQKHIMMNEPGRGTVVSQAFTSKPARGLRNKITQDLEQLQAKLPTSLIGLVSVGSV